MKNLLTLLFASICLVTLAQQTDVVDFVSIEAEIEFDAKNALVKGQSRYIYTILKPTDSIVIDAKNMNIIDVSDHHYSVEYSYNKKQLVYKAKFETGKTYELNIVYNTKPKKALYFIDWNNNENHPEYNPQIWTQGQGKYTSNWLPSIDNVNDKIKFDLAITFNNNFEVIANGKLVDKQIGETETKWHYTMQQPMSSYLVALAIGTYKVYKETSKNGILLSYYYYPKDTLKVASTYKYSKQMFDFLEDEIGVVYPWQNYKQVPVKDFLYSGMENTSCTIFSDVFMVDAVEFNDNNYVNVNAHELAHQWFGDLVTATSEKHHWLQEGFATYYALLAEKDVFGNDYYYQQLYHYAQELIAQDNAGQSTALLNPKSSSTTFYKKGAWVLHVLREKVGDKSFKDAVKHYLERYKYKNVTTQNFIDEVEKSSGQDLTLFVKKWLEASNLLVDEMNQVLSTNENTSFLITHLETPYLSYRTDEANQFIPSSLVYTLPKGSSLVKEVVLEEAFSKPDYPTYNDLILEALSSKALKVRQKLAFLIQDIDSSYQKKYENLLKDNSYLNQEAILYKLWINFPKDRAKYLEATKHIIGNNDKNIRLLWLVLALNTENYQKQAYYNELVNYTNSIYATGVRQNAFIYLNDLNAFNAVAHKNLEQATHHHSWRFSSFAKKLLEQVKHN